MRCCLVAALLAVFPVSASAVTVESVTGYFGVGPDGADYMEIDHTRIANPVDTFASNGVTYVRVGEFTNAVGDSNRPWVLPLEQCSVTPVQKGFPGKSRSLSQVPVSSLTNLRTEETNLVEQVWRNDELALVRLKKGAQFRDFGALPSEWLVVEPVVQPLHRLGARPVLDAQDGRYVYDSAPQVGPSFPNGGITLGYTESVDSHTNALLSHVQKASASIEELWLKQAPTLVKTNQVRIGQDEAPTSFSSTDKFDAVIPVTFGLDGSMQVLATDLVSTNAVAMAAVEVIRAIKTPKMSPEAVALLDGKDLRVDFVFRPKVDQIWMWDPARVGWPFAASKP